MAELADEQQRQYRAMGWHDDTLRIAGRSACPSPSAEAAVRALEARTGCTVPAALRELLTTDIWQGLLREFSNDDVPLAVGDMGTAHSPWQKWDARAAGILPFMCENQGVCNWAVPLNRGDDPPVLVEVDSGDPPSWQTAAETFSTWVRCQVEDQLVLGRSMFAAQAEPLGDGIRAALSLRFTRGLTTSGWPSREILRFHGELGDLLLWSADDQCDWWVAPRDLANAEPMLSALPLSANTKRCFYALQPIAEPVLDTWRR